MDNSNEASSSLSFVSSHLSNASSNTHNEHVANIEIVSLNKLSGSLEKLLSDVVDYDYCDAEIVVEEIPVGIHRCILASRSQFFHELFKKGKDGDSKEGKGKGKPSYQMKDLVCYGSVGYEAFVVFLHYLYTGKLKAPPTEVMTCVDEACIHDSCRPAIDYALELIYASSTFQMKELVLLFQVYILLCINLLYFSGRIWFSYLNCLWLAISHILAITTSVAVVSRSGGPSDLNPTTTDVLTA